MKSNKLIAGLCFPIFALLIIACDSTDPVSPNRELPSKQTANTLDIGWNDIFQSAQYEVVVTPRAGGYTAFAKGKGTIPGGEYAGHKFKVEIEGHYTGVGMYTLDYGSAEVKIRSERFNSVSDPLLQSFCCGEGHLMMDGSELVFSLFGQVVHTTASPPHNHLFAGLGHTGGMMNMNIADQTGTVVEQAIPPHDPGIGLIIDIPAHPVRVEMD